MAKKIRKATRKSITRKIKATDSALALQNADPLTYLRQIYETFDLGRVWNSRLAELCYQPNPLARIPDFVTDQNNQKRVQPLRVETNNKRTSREHQFIDIGFVHGYELQITRYGRHGRTIMQAGCRHFESETEARAHWPNNVSRESQRTRPHATAMIDYVATICRQMGWPW